MALSIALDGPVGAGKSTIADEVARRLDILHLDTGAMYRAVGLSALRRGLDIQDEAAVTAMCRALRITVSCGPGGQRTLVDGEDVTHLLRTEDVSLAASAVARYAGVRQAMVTLQQQLAATTAMLVDGRDIGTNVLPDATVKIYLTASAEERARRRHVQLGGTESYEQVLADLRRRDDQDMHRAVSPLRVADNAVVVDSTELDFNQTVEEILALVKEKSV